MNDNFFINFRYKFNITFPVLKLNMSERKIGELMNFSSHHSRTNVTSTKLQTDIFSNDKIHNRFAFSDLGAIRDRVGIIPSFTKYKRHKIENGKIRKLKKE